MKQRVTKPADPVNLLKCIDPLEIAAAINIPSSRYKFIQDQHSELPLSTQMILLVDNHHITNIDSIDSKYVISAHTIQAKDVDHAGKTIQIPIQAFKDKTIMVLHESKMTIQDNQFGYIVLQSNEDRNSGYLIQIGGKVSSILNKHIRNEWRIEVPPIIQIKMHDMLMEHLQLDIASIIAKGGGAIAKYPMGGGAILVARQHSSSIQPTTIHSITPSQIQSMGQDVVGYKDINLGLW